VARFLAMSATGRQQASQHRDHIMQIPMAMNLI
jgi:hypothetical protein